VYECFVPTPTPPLTREGHGAPMPNRFIFWHMAK
jgi:hypothetical protein